MHTGSASLGPHPRGAGTPRVGHHRGAQGQGQGHASTSQWKENVGFEGLQWLGAMCGKDTCHRDPQLIKHLPVSALEPQELNRVLKTRHSRLRSHQRTETLEAIRVGG